MRLLAASRTVAIPDGVTVEIKGRKARVVGPRGASRVTLKRRRRAVFRIRAKFCGVVFPAFLGTVSPLLPGYLRFDDMKAVFHRSSRSLSHGYRLTDLLYSSLTGTLSRDLSHLALDMYITKDEEGKSILKVDCHSGKKIKLAQIRTACSHVQNMITGVTLGFKTMMRLVYAHFPININVTKGGECVEIRNFLGEKRVRVVNMLAGCKIERSEAVKDELIISGNDIELVNRSAAMVHDICTVF